MQEPKKFVVSQTLWGNIYKSRFYIDGKRVPEWVFDVAFNTLAKSGASYTRKAENLSATKYRITIERV